jgi:hypothetical protein
VLFCFAVRRAAVLATDVATLAFAPHVGSFVSADRVADGRLGAWLSAGARGEHRIVVFDAQLREVHQGRRGASVSRRDQSCVRLPTGALLLVDSAVSMLRPGDARPTRVGRPCAPAGKVLEHRLSGWVDGLDRKTEEAAGEA